MSSPNSKPRILISRGVFPEVVQRLETYFEVEPNPADTVWTKAELIERLRDKDGAFTTGGDRIDAEVLAACPKLKICANMAVGYNNFDVAAMNAAGVVGTNTPDVLTETTADFGFALMMATARRITEGENYIRRGDWHKWKLDFFCGAEVHDSTLGIIDNGRGMSQEDLEKYSKAYARKEGQKEKGSGLGLNICIAILREHGFSISAQRQEEGGTLIKVRVR